MHPPAPVQRHAIRVRGTVQGVGFRPFVHRLAGQHGLQGWVLNDGEGVLIEAQGPAEALQRFAQDLQGRAPALARVAGVQVRPLAAPAAAGPGGFHILASPGTARQGVRTTVPPDTATCSDCLAELFDPANRRHRHAFINCTQCGPRYTLTRQLPYDRAHTSMAAFAQCPECLREYTTPADRRFHAEPNACPACGPVLALCDAGGSALAGAGEDAIAATLAQLRAGQVVAIKGLGGFHLACDARNTAAVARLRLRKQREAKPFALMLANAASARAWAQVDSDTAALLASPARPIVLLPQRGDVDADPAILQGLAPGLHTLGVMLPCTPIQFLLFHQAAGSPAGTAWLEAPQDLALVMTSANPGGEPLVRTNSEALERLQGLADAWLMHDRDIVARCDDSVLCPAPAGPPRFVRRARGYTPQAIALAGLSPSSPSVLALGGGLKNTVCVTRGAEAFLSPHIGSLDNAATCEALVEAAAHLCRVLDVQPQAVAHDLHPDFFSTRHARALAAARGLPCFAVQHHHAHIAAVVAEHGLATPVLGLALDGVGLGGDGQAWGGELLRVHGGAFQRLGHLAPLPLPGGDAAAREPWRMAAAALHQLGRGSEIEARYGHHAAAGAVRQMLERGLRCPPSSSLGRCFDAAAALLGLCEINAYEGQAAMLLEARAGLAEAGAARSQATVAPCTPPQGASRPEGEQPEPLPQAAKAAPHQLSLLPLLAEMADMGAGAGAARTAAAAAHFHARLAQQLAAWVGQHAAACGTATVALGGGCLLNQRLAAALTAQLSAQGLRVIGACLAPPNDGGLALGQAWVALQRLQSGPAPEGD